MHAQHFPLFNFSKKTRQFLFTPPYLFFYFKTFLPAQKNFYSKQIPFPQPTLSRPKTVKKKHARPESLLTSNTLFLLSCPKSSRRLNFLTRSLQLNCMILVLFDCAFSCEHLGIPLVYTCFRMELRESKSVCCLCMSICWGRMLQRSRVESIGLGETVGR